MAKIRVKESRQGTDILVHKAPHRGAADLLVYLVRSRFDAQGDELWYYVDTDSEATSKLFWVKDGGAADLSVFFVDSRGAAGWQGNIQHPLKDKL